MKKTILLFGVIGVLLTSCGSNLSSQKTVPALGEYVVETVKKNTEEYLFDPEDIVIDEVHFGSFTQKNTREAFIVCKILNMSHVGGLGRKEGMIMNLDTNEITAYKSFPFDTVNFACLSNADGQDWILSIGTITYQGLSTQDIGLYAIEGDEWENLPIENLTKLADEKHYLYVSDNSVLVTWQDCQNDVVLKELIWNPKSEQFEEGYNRFRKHPE